MSSITLKTRIQTTSASYRGVLFLLFGFCLLMVGLYVSVTSKTSFGGDFFTFWQAGRAVLIHETSPYDPSTTEIIQQGIYQGLANPDQDQLAFVYPPFSLLPVFPSVSLSYAWAQAYWMAFNLLLVFLGAFTVYKKPPLWWLASLIFFYPVTRNVILGSYSLMIVTGCLVAYGLLNGDETPGQRKQFLAGIFLGFCAMKPHLSWLIILFVLLQSLHRREWFVLIGLVSSGLILSVISWVLVPTWVSDWINAISRYAGYVPNQPIFINWLSSLGINWSLLGVKLVVSGITLAGTILLLVSWWKGQMPDFLALGWLILVNQLVNPNPSSMLSDQIVFLLPLLLWIRKADTKKLVRSLSWLLFILVPWALFGVYQTGKEPYAAASGLALLYVAWWSFMWIDLIRGQLQFRKKTLTVLR